MFVWILEPIYNENEETLDWSAGIILEIKESLTCPNGYERNGSFCYGTSI
jgi:hypothetical protein